MRIWHLLSLLAGIALVAVLAGCSGGGGGGTNPNPQLGTVTVDDTNQQVLYTPPSGRQIYSVAAYGTNIDTNGTCIGVFHYNPVTGNWALDTSSDSAQFSGTAIGTFDVIVKVVFDTSSNLSVKVGSTYRITLNIIGNGPPPPPWTN